MSHAYQNGSQHSRSSLVSHAFVFGRFALVGAIALTAGCKVQVDKSGDGEKQKVAIATPFGDIAVNQDAISAADVGLPVYPGSVIRTDDDGSKSANVNLGFGSWRLRVKVAHYSTTDSHDQVLAFYRKALSQYGTVIQCAGEQPVGTPTRTAEGLTCSDDEDHEHHGTHHDGSDSQLKAGSKRHQHIVALKDSAGGQTRFSLIELELPHGEPHGDDQQGTN